MKRTLLATCMAFLMVTAYAQNSYIVKTSGVLEGTRLETLNQEEETAIDFISQNFKFQSLCDWQEGMKFMVIPSEYDMVVKTFTDAATEKDVSSVKLRHKIMIYMGHEEDKDGHERINFRCQDDYTKTQFYRVDTELDGDGYLDVVVDKDVPVTVKAVGVGTRDFPVKIIVEDADGNEFYQNVAISKTNCSLNDDDFVNDNAKFLFGNSFELVEDVLSISSNNYKQFLGKIIHTKYPTKLLNEFSKKMQSIPRLTEYQIEAMNPHKNDDKFTLKLKNTTLGTYFYIDMLLDEHLAQDQTEYFGYIFALGPGKKIETSEGSRAMMRAGHVGIGFTEDETMMAAGEPDKVINGENGLYTWVYQRSNNKLLYVDFNGSGVVTKTYTRDNNAKSSSGTTNRRNAKSAPAPATDPTQSWMKGTGTPITK